MTYRTYAFEKLDVYHAANQLARVIGAVVVTLPTRKERVGKRLIKAAVVLGQGIAGANAEMPAHDPLTIDERKDFLALSTAAAARIRCTFLDLRREHAGSRSHIVAGLELVERIESALEVNREQIRPGFDPIDYAKQQVRRYPAEQV